MMQLLREHTVEWSTLHVFNSHIIHGTVASLSDTNGVNTTGLDISNTRVIRNISLFLVFSSNSRGFALSDFVLLPKVYNEEILCISH